MTNPKAVKRVLSSPSMPSMSMPGCMPTLCMGWGQVHARLLICVMRAMDGGGNFRLSVEIADTAVALGHQADTLADVRLCFISFQFADLFCLFSLCSVQFTVAMAWNAFRYACADLAPQSWTLLSQLTPTSADITEKHTASVVALGKGASVLYMFCTHSRSRSRFS
jgi:hypothetical protein